MQITLTSHKFDTIQEKDRAVQKALYEIGLKMERYAKEELSKPKAHKTGESPRPNVDTGRLRASITFATEDEHSHGGSESQPSDYATHMTPSKGDVYVGTNVEYAEYIEKGTSRMSPYPYLAPAVQDHIDEYKQIMESTLKG